MAVQRWHRWPWGRILSSRCRRKPRQVSARRQIQGVSMFAWFQRLLPRKGDFFGMFEAHASTLVEAARALRQLTDGASTADVLKLIRDREHDADEVIRQVLTEVRKTFLTP